MKRPFHVTIDVMAYSEEDAQAKVELLLQMGAFCKDFNINNLAGSFIKSFIVSKFGELAEKKKLERIANTITNSNQDSSYGNCY